jgi:hypothetical protein
LFISIISINIYITDAPGKHVRGRAISENFDFACRTESTATCPANGPSLSQIFRQKYPLKCASAGENGSGRKFCTAGIDGRADFFIELLKVRCSIQPFPVRQRPGGRRRTLNTRKCSINTIICTLVMSSPFALFQCFPPCALAARLTHAGDPERRAIWRRIGLPAQQAERSAAHLS